MNDILYLAVTLFTRALSPRTRNANGQKSFVQLDRFLPLLSTKPTVFFARVTGVFLILCVCWIQVRKLSSLSSLSHVPPGGNTHSAQVLFPQLAGKPPVARNSSTCAVSKMTIAMLVVSQVLGAF